jgi:hypothetical protein
LPRFPALDEEPPPTHWRTALVVAVVVVLVGGVTAGAFALTASDDDKPTAVVATPRPTDVRTLKVLALDDTDTLVLTSPTDGSQIAATEDSTGIGSALATLSPNRRLLLTGDGDLFEVRDSGPRLLDFVAPAGLQGQVFPVAQPWAARGRSIIFIGAGGGSRERVILFELGSNSERALGVGTDASGVPTARAAVVTTSTSRHPRDAGELGPAWPAAAVEWRTPSARHVLLTAAGFARALHLPRGRAYRLTAAVTPDGGWVAIYGGGFGSAARGGVVVVTPTGDVVGSYRARPIADAVWSPDSSTLAVTSGGSTTTHLAMLDVRSSGVRARDVRFPAGASGAGLPVWSSSGRTRLLVPTDGGWFIVDPAPGEPTSGELVESSVAPVAWLPGGDAS